MIQDHTSAPSRFIAIPPIGYIYGRAKPPFTQVFTDAQALAVNVINQDLATYEAPPVVWQELANGELEWDEAAARLLLSAADPSRVNWQAHHWWRYRL